MTAPAPHPDRQSAAAPAASGACRRSQARPAVPLELVCSRVGAQARVRLDRRGTPMMYLQVQVGLMPGQRGSMELGLPVLRCEGQLWVGGACITSGEVPYVPVRHLLSGHDDRLHRLVWLAVRRFVRLHADQLGACATSVSRARVGA